MHIFRDGLRLRGQFNAVARQPPQDGRDTGVHQGKFIAEKEWLGLEYFGARADRLGQHFTAVGGCFALRIRLDVARQGVPIALDPIQGHAKSRATHFP